MAALAEKEQSDGVASEILTSHKGDKKKPFFEKKVLLFEQNKPVGDRTIYDLKLIRLYLEGEYSKMQFSEKNPHKGNKVIMMVGETGSGKTTLINALINYILGVEWEDNYRYRLINENISVKSALSQTSEITIYQINHMEGFTIPFSLTIIDTPGFDSTEGREQDRHTAQQFQELFSSQWSIDHIDAICFVVKSSCNRLTDTQKYVFDSIASLFGKDIEQNILICVTYADKHRPKVLKTLKEAQFPYAKINDKPAYFKFNNNFTFKEISDSEADDEGNEDNDRDCCLDKPFYDMGKSSSSKLFNTLQELVPKSLFITKLVLNERKVLEITLEGLLPKIQEITLKQHELEKTEWSLHQHKEEIRNDGDFEYEEKETIKQRKNVLRNAINCHECESTCHYPCSVQFNAFTGLCEVFTWRRVCTMCEHGVSSHYFEDYIWENVVETKKKTYTALKKKYEDACNEKLTIEKLSEHLKKEITSVEDKVMELIRRAAQSLQRLQEIALKPDPLTVPDYIDLLIRTEEQETKPGYKERIDTLTKAKVKAENLLITATPNI